VGRKPTARESIQGEAKISPRVKRSKLKGEKRGKNMERKIRAKTSKTRYYKASILCPGGGQLLGREKRAGSDRIQVPLGEKGKSKLKLLGKGT